MTHEEALALLTQQCAAAIAPVLDDDTLAALLASALRYSTWQDEHDYSYGDVVQPTVPNGHLYRCLHAGTSGLVEPGYWPLVTAPDTRPGLSRPYWDGYSTAGVSALAQITDGTVVWGEAGDDDGQPWDVRAAVYAAWLTKAGLASADYDVSTEGDRLRRSQVAAHCLAMAQHYAPTRIA